MLQLALYQDTEIPTDRLELDFAARTKSRQRVQLASGMEAALLLERGTVLRGGQRLKGSDGRIIEVIAAPEELLEVHCQDPLALARAAYHLGNRHVSVEIGEGWLRIQNDHVLEHMLLGLGVAVSVLRAPFEPESGAYSSGSHAHEHKHSEGEPSNRPKIHMMAE